MKKKPPPGATLIARMKEQRLAREAELARRQAEAAAKESGSESAEASAAAPVDAAPARVEEKPAAKTASPAAKSPAATSSAAANDSVEVTVVDAVPVSAESTQLVVRAGKSSAADLIRREIDFEELRPVSLDYDVLTEEIKLAGRFAAVGLIAQGLRLACLKQDAIYKNHYPTFEDYCRKEHQMSATYAYRLIRMSEMAEQMAQIGTSISSGDMPDPFEVMLTLGHRHLMALLPLEPSTAQDLLVRGIPLKDAEEGTDGRLPISHATEKQIREALRALTGELTVKKAAVKKALATEQQLVPALSKLVEMLEDWSLWLGDEPPAELEAARMGRGQLLKRLARRFRAASGKIADALEGDEQ